MKKFLFLCLVIKLQSYGGKNSVPSLVPIFKNLMILQNTLKTETLFYSTLWNFVT